MPDILPVMRSNTPSLQMRAELRKLGQDLSIARRRRRMTQARLAEGAGIDVSTVRRLEHGHPSITIGTLAMVLLVLGESGRLEQLLDVARDDLGLALEIAQLPKRVRATRSIGPTSRGGGSDAEDDGVF